MGNGTLFNFISKVKYNIKCSFYIVMIIPAFRSKCISKYFEHCSQSLVCPRITNAVNYPPPSPPHPQARFLGWRSGVYILKGYLSLSNF